MHFHLATVLILIPLLTAAPTPKPVEVTDTVNGALDQLTGGLGKLPTGNGKRADITETLTNTLGSLTGGLTKPPGGKRQVPDVAKTLTDALNQVTGGSLTKLPTGGKREAPADIAGTLTSTVEGLTGGLTKLPGGKRQVPDVAKTLTDALNQVTGGSLTKLPTGGKRAEPAGIADTLTGALGGLGGLANLPGGKRQVPDVAKTLTDALNQVTGGSLTKLPTGGKREAPADIAGTLTSTVEGLTGGLTKLPGGKRQAPDIAGTLKTVADLALGQGNVENPKQLLGRESVDVATALKEALTIAKPVTNFPNGKRDTIDVTKALGEIVDPVNAALAKDYSKDFKFPAGTKKPNGKRNDGIDVGKALGQIVSPFSDALGKDYGKGYTLPDGTKIPPSKRGGIDGSGAVAAVLGQITGAIENSKDFHPEATSQSHERRGDILGGLVATLTGALGGVGKLPGSSKRQDAADAANSVPLAGPLLMLAETLGGGVLKDGKVPKDFKLPDGSQIPPQTKQEKRVDVASAAKGVVYEVIDGVTKPTKNL